MSNIFLPAVPFNEKDKVAKLYKYGYSLTRYGDNSWIIYYPKGRETNLDVLYDYNFGTVLLTILRKEEELQGTLLKYQQFDSRWEKTKYGFEGKDSTMKSSACGPTSIAIVLQYLINSGCIPNDSSEMKSTFCAKVTPVDVANFAVNIGARKNKTDGTNVGLLAKNLTTQWPDYSAEKISIEIAIDLLKRGHLIVFSSHGGLGYKAGDDLSKKPTVRYGKHYMVLSGVDDTKGSKQLFSVIDPSTKGMAWIRREELGPGKTNGFYIVYKTKDAGNIFISHIQ